MKREAQAIENFYLSVNSWTNLELTVLKKTYAEFETKYGNLLPN